MIYRPQMLHTFTSCTRRQYTKALIVILMIKMETNYIWVACPKSLPQTEPQP